MGELEELSAKRLEIIQRDNAADMATKAKEYMQIEMARRVPKMLAVIDEAMDGDHDIRIKLQAIEMLLVRLVPKVAIAQEEKEKEEVKESFDKVAQREKIQRAIEKKIEEERKSGGV